MKKTKKMLEQELAETLGRLNHYEDVCATLQAEVSDLLSVHEVEKSCFEKQIRELNEHHETRKEEYKDLHRHHKITCSALKSKQSRLEYLAEENGELKKLRDYLHGENDRHINNVVVARAEVKKERKKRKAMATKFNTLRQLLLDAMQQPK